MSSLSRSDRYRGSIKAYLNLHERYLIPIKIIMVYVAWKVFYPYTQTSGTALHLWWIDFTSYLGSAYANVVSVILNYVGVMATVQGVQIVLLKSNSHISVSEHCLAIPAMVIFAGSVIFFRGRLVPKLAFIAIGFLGIICINIFRIFFVSVAWMKLRRDFYLLNHSVLYVLMTYSFIFLMLMWWIRRVIAQEQMKHEGDVN